MTHLASEIEEYIQIWCAAPVALCLLCPLLCCAAACCLQ